MLIASLALVSHIWRLSAPIPLEPELLEAWLGCLPHNEQVVSAALQQLQAIRAGSIRSSDIGRLHRTKHKSLSRVQIVNGSLFLTCPRRRQDEPTAACLRTDVLTLLLSLARLPDVDFIFDGGENTCHKMHQHNTREAAVPIFTTETADGCDNVLVPPRALAFDLPDNARWAARAAQADGAWAWHRRINRALFRGSTTGGAALNGTGHASSKRAKVVAFSLRHPELLDARFTTRGGVGAVQAGAGTSSLEAELLRRGMAERGAFLTWYDALRYRAALVVDGNTVADRLPFVMASATAVIKVDSPRREAFYSLLRPYEHYVPVRADLSDLEAQLRWALANETRLHAIARNGAAFALRHLSRRATLCHWTSLLLVYATRMAGPVQLDADAVRVPARPPTSLPMIIEPVVRSTALRPQLSHSPPWPSDLFKLLTLHATPCVGLSWRYLCVDL